MNRRSLNLPLEAMIPDLTDVRLRQILGAFAYDHAGLAHNRFHVVKPGHGELVAPAYRINSPGRGVGQITVDWVSIPPRKNILVYRIVDSDYTQSHSSPAKGRSSVVTNVGWVVVDAGSAGHAR